MDLGEVLRFLPGVIGAVIFFVLLPVYGIIKVLRTKRSYSVGKLQEQRDVKGLGDLLNGRADPHIYQIDRNVRIRAAKALRQLGDAQSIHQLVEGLESTDEVVHRAAMDALGKMSGSLAAELVALHLGHRERSVRKDVLGALEKLGWIKAGDVKAGGLNWLEGLEDLGLAGVRRLLGYLAIADQFPKEQAIVTALEKIVLQWGNDMSLDDLRVLARIKSDQGHKEWRPIQGKYLYTDGDGNPEYEWIDKWEMLRVDCSQLNNHARQALTRRGEPLT